MKPTIEEDKIVIFTGSGISAESGLATFRCNNGLWHDHDVNDVATRRAWKKDPELVLRFYNELKLHVAKARPNSAHLALAALEERFRVIVITQNIDDLHERAGSSNVIHLHGQLSRARSSVDEDLLYELGGRPIAPGDTCEKGSQLRPDVVWFGETIQNYGVAMTHLATAGRVLVVGTSLSVVPAARMLRKARGRAEKIIVGLEVYKVPYGFRFMRGKATALVPAVVGHWLGGRRAIY